MASLTDTVLRSPTHPILLRFAKAKDAPALSRILSNPENIEFDPMCSTDGMTEAQCLEMIKSDRKDALQPIPKNANFLIVLLPSINSSEDGEVIGLSGFGGIDVLKRDGKVKRFGDVGAMIDPEYRRKGYAVESMRLSIEFAFEKLSVDGISASMLEKNVAIVGLMENVFGWKGVRSESRFGKEVRFEISEGDWPETRERLKSKGN